MASLVGSSLSVLAVRVGGAALQLVLVGLAVMFFPIREVGYNGILWTTAVIARGVGPLGTDLYALREMPALWESKERAQFFAMCRGMSVDLFKLLVFPTAVLGVALAAAVDADRVPWDLAVALPVAVVCSAAQRLWSTQIRCQERIVLSQIVEGVLMPLLAILLMLVSAMAAPSTFILGQALAMVVGAWLSWALLVRGQDRSSRFRMDGATWRTVVPLGVGSGLSVLASRLPILFVGLHSAVQAAHYDIGQRVHSAATLSSQAAAAVFLPRVRQLTLASRIRQMARELVTASALGAVPAALVVIGLWAVGPQRIEAALGPEYAGTWEIGMLLGFAALVNASTGLCHGLLAMTGHSRTFMVIAALQCVLVVGFAALFSGSAVDMAWFVVAAELARSVVLVALAVHVFKSLSTTHAAELPVPGELNVAARIPHVSAGRDSATTQPPSGTRK